MLHTITYCVYKLREDSDSIELRAIFKAIVNTMNISRYISFFKFIYSNATVQVKLYEDNTIDKIPIENGDKYGYTIHQNCLH